MNEKCNCGHVPCICADERLTEKKLANYHKALADVLHLIDMDDLSEGSADLCNVEDAWDVLNTEGAGR